MERNKSERQKNKGNAIGFSVVMPSFNQVDYIRDALDSLLNQNYENLEIIVIDGGSTDGTVDILRSYGKHISWISEEDDGQSDALRKGFDTATKEWITWLNSDDVQTNEALHHVQRAIRENPKAQVIVGQGHYIDQTGKYLRPYPCIEVNSNSDVNQELFEKGYVAQPSVYFRRDAYEAIGGIDSSLQFVMDYDLWVRFAHHDCQFVTIDADISGNRWHETAKTASQLLSLLAEATAVQIREYGHVSAYFVQAISDYLYNILQSRHRDDRYHLLLRQIYFKSVWVWVNFHHPTYCVWGLLTQNIAKSGPIIGDRLTIFEVMGLPINALRHKLLAKHSKKNF